MINSKMKPQPGEGGDCGRDKVWLDPDYIGSS
jgi:hypothetical protein